MTELDVLRALIRAVLHAPRDDHGEISVSLPALPPFDWEALYTLADAHRVTELAAFALRGHGEYRQRGEAFEREAAHALILESVMHFETLALYDEFERAAIDFCPLKGIVLKDLYPLPWMRSMQDVDILVHPEQAGDAVAAAEACGYVYLEFRSVHHVLSDEQRLFDLELHERLMSPWSRHEEINDRVWNATVAKTPGGHHRALPPDKQYLYHIIHADKHITRGEKVPIRTLVDLYLMEQAYGETLRQADAELEAIGLSTLANDLSSIARAWFGQGETNKRQNQLIAYIINSADATNAHQEAYNHERLFWTQRLVRNGDLSIKRMLFPSREWLTTRYPVLREKPALIPVYRLMRGPASVVKLLAHYIRIAWLRLRGAVSPGRAGKE